MGKPYSLSTIINAIYDETTRALKTTASFTGTLEVHLDKDNDSVTIYGNDGVVNRVMKTDADGHIQADILSSALPTGAATESKQDDTIVQLQRIAGLTDTDFATSAKQDDALAQLQQIAGLTTTDFATESTLNTVKENVTNLPKVPTAWYTGLKRVNPAGTTVSLFTSQAIQRVIVKALAGNTDTIYVSPIGAADAHRLAAGEEVPIVIDDLVKVILDADTSNDGVTFSGS